jgi:hypothetical protein
VDLAGCVQGGRRPWQPTTAYFVPGRARENGLIENFNSIETAALARFDLFVASSVNDRYLREGDGRSRR